MILNYQFENNRLFVRDRYSARLSKLIAVAKEHGEEVNVAERYMAKSDVFIISIQVGGKTLHTFDFDRLKEILEEMGGKFASFTLINTEEFHGLKDK